MHVFDRKVVVEGYLFGCFSEFSRFGNGVGRHTGVSNQRNAVDLAWNYLDDVASRPVHLISPLFNSMRIIEYAEADSRWSRSAKAKQRRQLRRHSPGR